MATTPGATNVSGSSKNIKDPGGAAQPMGHQTAPSAKPAPVPGPNYGGLATPQSTSQVKYGELGQIGPHSSPSGDAGWTSQQMGDMNVPTVTSTAYESLSTSPPGGSTKPSYEAMKHKGQG